jgi:hypothetical protein
LNIAHRVYLQLQAEAAAARNENIEILRHAF